MNMNKVIIWMCVFIFLMPLIGTYPVWSNGFKYAPVYDRNIYIKVYGIDIENNSNGNYSLIIMGNNYVGSNRFFVISECRFENFCLNETDYENYIIFRRWNMSSGDYTMHTKPMFFSGQKIKINFKFTDNNLKFDYGIYSHNNSLGVYIQDNYDLGDVAVIDTKGLGYAGSFEFNFISVDG